MLTLKFVIFATAFVASYAGLETTWVAKVVTSDIRGASTDAAVFIQIIGDEGKSQAINLDDQLDNFQTDGIDYFRFQTSAVIGTPTALRVWHDNDEDFPAWHLTRIQLERTENETYSEYVFNCDCWLASDHRSHDIDRVLPLATMNWRAWVTTGNSEDDSGTNEGVWIILYGDKGQTRDIPLNTEENDFEIGQRDSFIFSSVDIGNLSKIEVKVGMDVWELMKIELENMDGAERYNFDCYCWMGDAGNTKKVLQAS